MAPCYRYITAFRTFPADIRTPSAVTALSITSELHAEIIDIHTELHHRAGPFTLSSDHRTIRARFHPLSLTSPITHSTSTAMATFDYLHLLAYVGVLALLFVIPTPLLALYRLFLRPAKPLRHYGQWAVITGATDGIGRAYAFQLAKASLSLVLISRSTDKLALTEAEVKKKYPKAAIKTFPLDFDRFTPEAQAALAAFLQPLDVGVLVNNVGVSYAHPEYYHALSRDALQSMINLNVQAASLMTSIVLPQLLSKRRGCVVNVSSFASLITSPLLTQYSATKAYVNALTRGLQAEYSARGIRFQAQCPLFVTSKLSKLRKPSLWTPSPSTYAAAGVKAFGYEVVSVPYWPHALQNRLVQLAPQWVTDRVVLSMHTGLRNRAQKKAQTNTTQGKTE